jgi:hypothetical protein
MDQHGTYHNAKEDLQETQGSGRRCILAKIRCRQTHDSKRHNGKFRGFGKDFASAMKTYVDLTEHPLCDPTHPVTQIYQHHGKMSHLPCCLSTHCMIRQDFFSASNTSDPPPFQEEMLLLDSKYDPFAIAAASSNDPSHRTGFADVMGQVWSTTETAGSRLARPMETAAFLGHTQISPTTRGPRGIWVVSSCVTHSFFVPSVELLHQKCIYGHSDGKEYAYRCREDGFGVQTTFQNVDMETTLWQTTNVWNLAQIEGRSVRDICHRICISERRVTTR